MRQLSTHTRISNTPTARLNRPGCGSRRGVRVHNFLFGGSQKDTAKLQTNAQVEKRIQEVVSSSATRSPELKPDKALSKPKLALSWAGAGIYFFWQLGAMKYLAERYDLSRTPMVGASGGALASVLACCGVPADQIIRHAFDLSVKHNIWERSLGLMGVWGAVVEEWLDDLLPEDAHERCRNNVTVVVTTLPNMKQVGITDFTSKQDLIDACMASSHIPLFLDMRLARNLRGTMCVDGSVPDFLSGMNCDLLTKQGMAVVFDYFDDSLLNRKGRMEMIELKTHEEIHRMYQLGYNYAHKLHEEGRFDKFHLAEVLLTESGHMQVMTRI